MSINKAMLKKQRKHLKRKNHIDTGYSSDPNGVLSTDYDQMAYGLISQ